jgi:hypothetical protein
MEEEIQGTVDYENFISGKAPQHRPAVFFMLMPDLKSLPHNGNHSTFMTGFAPYPWWRGAYT